jgi:hypothetical protein
MDDKSFDLIKDVGFFLAGGIATIFYQKIKDRPAILKKDVFIQRLAFSTATKDFGSIQILFNGNPTSSLYLITAVISNDSNKDFKELNIQFGVPEGFTIQYHWALNEVDGIYKTLSYTQKYHEAVQEVQRKRKELGKDDDPNFIHPDIKEQVIKITRHRVFEIDMFKRKTKATFEFLVEDIYGNATEPSLFVTIPESATEIIEATEQSKLEERKRKFIEVVGLIIFILCSYPVYLYSTTIGFAIGLMIVNLFCCSIVAVGLYNSITWAKKYFSV